MSRQFSPLAVLTLVLPILAIGCRPQQPFYFHEDGDLSHYVGVATNIDYPDAVNPSLDDVQGAAPPLTLANSKPKEMWDLPLHDVMDVTLRNSKVFRNLGGVAFGPTGAQGDPSGLQGQPTAIPSMYTPAIVETDPRYGVEGALAAFDAQFNASVAWERLDTPQNVPVGGSLSSFRPSVDREDLGTFQASLSKTTAEGGTFALINNTGYNWANSTYRQWPSAWTTNFVAQFSQPLLQGAGAEFNRIAGPNAIPGFYNGVMIARLRTDVALSEFEQGVRNLARDVERNYWELAFAYRQLDAAIAGRDSSLQTWRQVYAKYLVGGRGGSAQEESQARAQYFTFRTVVEESLSNLYRTESTLRYLMGIAPTDGRLIRPSDEPTTARVDFDWYTIHAESLTRSAELRQQKFIIKQRELELIASKNFLLPQLNAIGQYRWLGLGDDLIDPNNNTSNAFGSMTSGEFQEWQLGLNLSMPLGFRRELAGVRNAQLQLARERAVLQDQELELTTDLTNSVRDLNDFYTVTQTNFNRRSAAQDEVKAVEAAYNQGVVNLDLLLLAQQRLAEAERAYYRSLIDYNEAITTVHFYKGSLLEYDGIMLAEGPWPNKAYFDATRLARARDASYYLNYGFTRPRVITRGPVDQTAPSQGMPNSSLPQPELVPTPAPELQATPEQQTARPAAGQRRLVQRPASSGQVKPASQGRSYDLSSVNLDPLGTTVPAAASVQPVSYQQPMASDGWRSTTSGSNGHEPVANPTSADAAGAASGWKGVQR